MVSTAGLPLKRPAVMVPVRVTISVPTPLTMLLASVLASSALLYASPVAQAGSLPAASHSHHSVYSATLNIGFDKKLSASQEHRVSTAIIKDLATRGNAVPTWAHLDCNHLYRFGDSDGSFTIQHRCKGTTGPWGFQISTGV